MILATMQNIFSENGRLQRWLDIEKELALAEAELGIIPPEAAKEIASKAHLDSIDVAMFHSELARTGHHIVSLLKPLQKACANNYGEFVHFGPTTQDIIDTGDQLAIKAAHQTIAESLRRVEGYLVDLTEKHAGTLMAGRTHGGHALPITFGFKTATWTREISRSIQRLEEMKKRLFVGMLAGAVGTYASLGENGPKVEKLVMERLGLTPPDICWAASRDRVAEFACALAVAAFSANKIVHEIYTMQKTELCEVEENVGTSVGSSTMPQKRNPRNCEMVMSLADKVKYLCMMQIDGMVVEHERGMAGWYMQRDTIGELCLTMADMLERFETVVRDLVVFPKRMRGNLDLTKGLIMCEPIMFELGKTFGKQTAHHILFNAAKAAFAGDRPLKDVLMEDARIKENLSQQALDTLLDPAGYAGLSQQIAQEIVAMTRQEIAQRG